MSIRTKLLALVAGPILVISIAGMVTALFALEARARREVADRLVESARSLASEYDRDLRSLATVAEMTARFLELEGDLDERGLEALLRANVREHPICFGSAIAFEPGAYRGRGRFSPYVHRDGDGLAYLDIGAESYDYTDGSWEWFTAPREAGAGVWTAPYLDEGAGDILMCTFAEPFLRDGAFAGVATVDVALEPLRSLAAPAATRETTFIILSPDGRYVYHDDPRLIMTPISERLAGLGREDLQDAARGMMRSGAGLVVLDDWQGAGEHWCVHAPIRTTGWTVVVTTSRAQALAPLYAQLRWLALALAAMLAIIVATLWHASGRVTAPVRRLRAAVERIGSGDLEAPRVPVEGRDEIADLARSFNAMAADLRSNIHARACEQAGSRDAVIFALARLAESRDEDTGRHLERICQYSEILARDLAGHVEEIDEAWIRTVTTTAALHDIGKVGVPDAVLKKKGKLTDEEYRVMQSHTTIGGDTLFALRQRWTETGFLTTATQIAFAHHEKWDGSGYPFGLSGEDIALEARIVAVADVYDALTMKRVYKPAMPHDDAARIIRDGAGSHFDPQVVRSFERVEEEFRRISEALGD